MLDKNKIIKVGDLVTVNLGAYSNSSNTYKIKAKIRGKKFVLAHPLTPECCIIKSEDELNMVAAILKNPTEKCLDFCQNNKGYLGFKIQASLDALCFYYVIKKDLAANQKEELASISAYVAAIVLKNDLSIAIKLISENEGVLDEYNSMWYAKLKPSFQNLGQLDNKYKRFIYKIAAFTMAQLGE